MELLFVVASSKDRRGRRVLIREGVIENVIYRGEKADVVDMKLLGLTQEQKRQIESFLARSPNYA